MTLSVISNTSLHRAFRNTKEDLGPRDTEVVIFRYGVVCDVRRGLAVTDFV
jgi:hypothetical protein